MGNPNRPTTTAAVQSLRAVALFEAAKGLLVLLLGLGVLAFIHRDLGAAAEALIARVHLNPERPYASAFLHAASNLTDARLWLISLGGVTYSAVRFIEAWGLWLNRAWAQYFGILSGALYLPWEAYEALRRPTWIHFGLLTGNALVVVTLLVIRLRQSSGEWLGD